MTNKIFDKKGNITGYHINTEDFKINNKYHQVNISLYLTWCSYKEYDPDSEETLDIYLKWRQ